MLRRLATAAASSRAVLPGGVSLTANQRCFISMTWGKYQDWEISDIPRPYLRRMLANYPQYLSMVVKAAIHDQLGLPPPVPEEAPEIQRSGILIVLTPTNAGGEGEQYSLALPEHLINVVGADVAENVELALESGLYELNRVHIGYDASCSDTLAPLLAQLLTKYGAKLQHYQLVAWHPNAIQLLKAVQGSEQLKRLKLNVSHKCAVKDIEELGSVLKTLPPIEENVKFLMNGNVGKLMLKMCTGDDVKFRAKGVIFLAPKESDTPRMGSNAVIDKSVQKFIGGKWVLKPTDHGYKIIVKKEDVKKK